MDSIPTDVDVYNFHDNGVLWMIKWAKKERKAKVVWQINDLPVCFRVWLSDAHKKSISNKISRAVYKSIIPCVDRITVNVTKNKDRVVELMGRDADVFYCGVDVNPGLETHFYKKGKKTWKILSAGVFFPRRNYETLVKVVFNLKQQSIPVHLDIIGSTDSNPEYAERIKNQINELTLSGEVTIWGQVDEQKYNELFNAADIFTFININQSWGLAVFEAMSSGLPTLVSNSVGAIELLHDGEDSLIVDPFDAKQIAEVIKTLFDDSSYYNQISANAANAVKEYTWDKLYSTKMVDVFRELTRG